MASEDANDLPLASSVLIVLSNTSFLSDDMQELSTAHAEHIANLPNINNPLKYNRAQENLLITRRDSFTIFQQMRIFRLVKAHAYHTE